MRIRRQPSSSSKNKATGGRRALATFVALTLAGCAVVGAVLGRYPSRLPSFEPSASVELLDARGERIWMPLNAAEERSIQLPLEAYPASLLHLVLLAEDRRFFEHGGVDARALARAAREAFYRGGRPRGASTISMQLARIVWPELKSGPRKLLQIVQAWRLETRHDKRELLEAYMARVPFSYQVAGFAMACRFFFDKECRELSLAEQAALVVLPRSPSRLARAPEALANRSSRLLGAYFESVASDAPVELAIQSLALAEQPSFALRPPRNYAPHFAAFALKTAPRGTTGTLRTTLDLEIQSFAQDLVRGLYRTKPGLGDSASVLVVERATGKVRAYVGGIDYDTAVAGRLGMVHRLRSPGSALKPFLYAKAIENGYSLATLLPDLPWVLPTDRGVHVPRNYSGQFTGPKQVRFALANSDNVPALRMAEILGEDAVLEILRRFGFRSLAASAGHYGAGLVLGNGEVSLWELARAYLALGSGGRLRELEVFESAHPSSVAATRALDPEIAYLIQDALSDPEARAQEFGRGGPLEFEHPVAVKTGTSSDFRDHWTIGFDANYVVAAWRGNASGRSLHQHLPAARNTGLVFRDLINFLRCREGVGTPLARPARIVEREVCSLSGHSPGPHCRERRRELFTHNHPVGDTCPYHGAIDLAACGAAGLAEYVELPEEYGEWAVARGLVTRARVVQQLCGDHDPGRGSDIAREPRAPRFEEPLDGAVFALDASLPRDHQRLRFLVRGRGARTLAVYRAGARVGALDRDGRLDWRVEMGTHEFELRDEQNGLVLEKIKIKVL